MARKLVITLCAFAVWAAAFASAALADDAPADPTREMIREEIEAYMKDQKKDFRVYWKDGLNFATRDKKFTMKLGGRIQLDSWYVADTDDRKRFEEEGISYRSGVEFRRVRLATEGAIYNNVAWKLQLDFAGAEVVFKDVWVQFRNLDECWGCMFPDIMVGHFKEYFSLEELTSSKYISFMERSLPVGAFAPSRNTGIGLFRDFLGEHMTLGVGWFGNAGDDGELEWQDGNNITGRLTWLPWAPCDCEHRFWEVGVSGSYRFDQRNGIRHRVRPEDHLGDRLLDTGVLENGDKEVLVGLETAFNYDRWGAQAEGIWARPSLDGEANPNLWGWYAQVTYQLNGGTRRFKRAYAVHDKIKPCKNFDCTECGHVGQWELAARYSFLDLEDKEVYGGRGRNFTLGLNWYLNPNARIMFNYVFVDATNARDDEDRPDAPSGLDGKFHLFGVRFQIFW